MLLSSILRILNQGPNRLEAVEKTQLRPCRATYAAAQEASGLEKIQLEIAAAAGLLRPFTPDPQLPVPNIPGSSLEELLRTIADLKKPDQSRFIDVFE